jgi:hypothetical protein
MTEIPAAGRGNHDRLDNRPSLAHPLLRTIDIVRLLLPQVSALFLLRRLYDG